MKTEIAKLKAAIKTAGIVELVAQSAALWFKAARVALFFKATNQRVEAIVCNDKGEPIELTAESFQAVKAVNGNATLRDAEKRLRAIATKCQADENDKRSGKATVNRKGGAGITGIRVNELPDIATNKALKAIATLKAELFAECVASYVTGKEPLDNLYNEFLINGKTNVIALNPERVAIAHKVIVELEKDDNHKSLSSFAWYPEKGTQAEKDAAIAKTLRSHYKRIEREKAVSNEQFQAALKAAEKAEKQPDTVTVEKEVKVGGKTATVTVHRKQRKPRQKKTVEPVVLAS